MALGPRGAGARRGAAGAGARGGRAGGGGRPVPWAAAGALRSPEALLEALDLDGDGRVGEADLAAALGGGAGAEATAREIVRAAGEEPGAVIEHEPLRAVLAKTLSAVGPAEAVPLPPPSAQRVQELFERFDADGDGVLSPEEIMAPLGLGEEEARGLFEQADADLSGGLDVHEFEVLLRRPPFSALCTVEKDHAGAMAETAGQFRAPGREDYDPALHLEPCIGERELGRAAKKAQRDLRYSITLAELQIELVRLQEHIKHAGLKVIVVFEGRDAAGKGGVISRIASAMSPRVTRVVALSAPTEREKSQWYFQRYVNHFPAAGEMVLFDRSWYNRAGVERVMGFCSEAELELFFEQVGPFEKMIVDSGCILLKYWLDVSDEEQEARFQDRLRRSWKRWKLSPMDLFARSRWSEYAEAKTELFARTSTEACPWHVVPSDHKKSARLNCIQHLLASIPYEEVVPKGIEIPRRDEATSWESVDRYVRHYATNQGARGEVVPQVYSAESLESLNFPRGGGEKKSKKEKKLAKAAKKAAKKKAKKAQSKVQTKAESAKARTPNGGFASRAFEAGLRHPRRTGGSSDDDFLDSILEE